MTQTRFFIFASILLLSLVSSTAAFAQDEATKVLNKMRQVDLLNQILPVLMTQEQLQKLLPPVERSRKATRDLERDELAAMKKLESKLDAAIKEAKDKNQVPPAELQTEIFRLLSTFKKNRALMVLEQNEAVLKAVEENLDEGQIKAATNALSLPSSDGEKLTDRAKLGRWVRAVLMDPLAYDLLVDLSRKK